MSKFILFLGRLIHLGKEGLRAVWTRVSPALARLYFLLAAAAKKYLTTPARKVGFGGSVVLFLVLIFSVISGAPRHIAVSDKGMTWKDARAWCAARGGRLPLINNAKSLGKDVLKNRGTLKIDGVGRVKKGPGSRDWTTSWVHSRLPDGHYWTGTVVADGPGGSWGFSDSGGSDGGGVYVTNYVQGHTLRVVCVP